MNKKISVSTAIALIFLAIAGSVAATFAVSMSLYNKLIPNLTDRSDMYNKLENLDSIVNEKYYYEIDGSARNNAMAGGYVEGLGDAGSLYLSADEYVDYDSVIRGKSLGIGVNAAYSAGAGGLLVREVYANSPAQSSGLLKGDVITKVEDEAVTAENAAAKLNMLQGSRLSSVKVTYLRGTEGEKSVSVAKGYTAQSVTYEKIGTTGYIRVTHFYENTITQMREALDKLAVQSIVSLVLDLRDTSVGDTQYAITTADLFVPLTEGTALVTAYDRNEAVYKTFSSDAASVSYPIAVLVNDQTAGPAEIFAVTLKDFGAQLVGQKTAGVGTMSEVFQLNDGSAVKLTVAVLKPYKSEIYDGVGLTPDIPSELTAQQRENLSLLSHEEDAQLQAALSYLNATGASLAVQ